MQKNYLKKKTSGETPVNSFKCIFRKSEDNVKKKKKPTVWTFDDIWQYKKEAWCIQRERLHEKVLWILTRRSNKTLTLKEKKCCH